MMAGRTSPDSRQGCQRWPGGIVAKYPKTFSGFVASLPMNNPNRLLKEMDRAVNQLGAFGVQFTPTRQGSPWTSGIPSRFQTKRQNATFQSGCTRHVVRVFRLQTEPNRSNEIWWTLGWPYESSVAMSRMVFFGIVRSAPEDQDHHPPTWRHDSYFEGRVGYGWMCSASGLGLRIM